MLLVLLDKISSKIDLWILFTEVVLTASVILGILVFGPKVLAISKQPKHLHKLGRCGSSNLSDQHKASYDGPVDNDEDEHARVKALYIHPIKSCMPIELDRAMLTKTGFAYDRCFVFATDVYESGSDDPLEWRFISQRTKPQMSLIKVELFVPSNDKQVSNGKNDLENGYMTVSFPWAEASSFTEQIKAYLQSGSWPTRPELSFTVPLMPTESQQKVNRIRIKTFKIHSRNATGLDFAHVPSFAAIVPQLKTFLKTSAKQNLTLLRCTPNTLTRTTLNLAPLSYIGTPAVHGYTDQQPIHIVNLSSVHDISTRLPPENQPLDARRFRANIYISGIPAYDEESWKRILVNSGTNENDGDDGHHHQPAQFSIVCRTSRCTMPNVDFNSGTFDHDQPNPGKKKGKPQPSTTLIEHRTVETGNPAALGYLGMHCVPEDASLNAAEKVDGRVWITVGDEVRVLEQGTHLYGSTRDDY